MIKQYPDFNLSSFNTFAIDVKCRTFLQTDDLNDMAALFPGGRFDGKWYVLGGGSNVLFTADFDGTIIHPVNDSIDFDKHGDAVLVRAGAGMEWDELCRICAGEGLWGIENLSGIPGTVGAAPVQNIGAYGAEAADSIVSVKVYDTHRSRISEMNAVDCGFGYRMSVFKQQPRDRYIILEVTFSLSLAPNPVTGYGELRTRVEHLGGPTIDNIRQAVTDIRDSKLPDPRKLGNAGSFFKNPFIDAREARRLKDIYPDLPVYPCAVEGMVKVAAGWLIEQAGWKGRRTGRVGVHEKQALVLVNYGGASGGEVLALAQQIIDSVREKFGITIEPEVNIL